MLPQSPWGATKPKAFPKPTSRTNSQRPLPPPRGGEGGRLTPGLFRAEMLPSLRRIFFGGSLFKLPASPHPGPRVPQGCYPPPPPPLRVPLTCPTKRSRASGAVAQPVRSLARPVAAGPGLPPPPSRRWGARGGWAPSPWPGLGAGGGPGGGEGTRDAEGWGGGKPWEGSGRREGRAEGWGRHGGGHGRGPPRGSRKGPRPSTGSRPRAGVRPSRRRGKPPGLLRPWGVWAGTAAPSLPVPAPHLRASGAAFVKRITFVLSSAWRCWQEN